jgi:hypothetical protein
MQVSTSGGIFPRWRKDGGELFYLAPDDRLMAVPMRPAPELRTISPGVPVALFPTRMTGGNVIVAGYAARAPYDVSSDGRFLMNVAIDEATRLPIAVVLNWQEELKRRVPVK